MKQTVADLFVCQSDGLFLSKLMVLIQNKLQCALDILAIIKSLFVWL